MSQGTVTLCSSISTSERILTMNSESRGKSDTYPHRRTSVRLLLTTYVRADGNVYPCLRDGSPSPSKRYGDMFMRFYGNAHRLNSVFSRCSPKYTPRRFDRASFSLPSLWRHPWAWSRSRDKHDPGLKAAAPHLELRIVTRKAQRSTMKDIDRCLEKERVNWNCPYPWYRLGRRRCQLARRGHENPCGVGGR